MIKKSLPTIQNTYIFNVINQQLFIECFMIQTWEPEKEMAKDIPIKNQIKILKHFWKEL